MTGAIKIYTRYFRSINSLVEAKTINAANPMYHSGAVIDSLIPAVTYCRSPQSRLLRPRGEHRQIWNFSKTHLLKCFLSFVNRIKSQEQYYNLLLDLLVVMVSYSYLSNRAFSYRRSTIKYCAATNCECELWLSTSYDINFNSNQVWLCKDVISMSTDRFW